MTLKIAKFQSFDQFMEKYNILIKDINPFMEYEKYETYTAQEYKGHIPTNDFKKIHS